MKSHQNPAGAGACTVLAPVSPAIAKLLHQLQTEMLKETHGLDVVPAGAIVLPALTTGFGNFTSNGRITTLSIGNIYDNEDCFTKYHCRPEGLDAKWWNPAHWHLHSYRKDSKGKAWNAARGAYVVDDFGNLVEVAI